MTETRISALEALDFSWSVVGSNNKSATETPLQERNIINDNNRSNNYASQLWADVKDLHDDTLFWESQLVLDFSEEEKAPLLIVVCDVAETGRKKLEAYVIEGVPSR